MSYINLRKLAALVCAGLVYPLLGLINGGAGSPAELLAPAALGALVVALAWAGGSGRVRAITLGIGALAGLIAALGGATAAAWGLALAWQTGLIWACLGGMQTATGKRHRAAPPPPDPQPRAHEERGAQGVRADDTPRPLPPSPSAKRSKGAGGEGARALHHPWPLRLARALAFAAVAGGGAALAGQAEAQFAEEEFFVALEALLLAAGWLALLGCAAGGGWRQTCEASQTSQVYATPRPPPDMRWRALFRRLAVLLLAPGLLFAAAAAYQGSFYDTDPPGYPGISAQAPFLCGSVAPPADGYDGEATFAALLDLLERHPLKGPPEYAMLAIGRGDAATAAMFREALLAEAAAGRFTEPANSIKYGQYEAALRVYAYDRVRAAFPGLFSAEDAQQIAAWLAAVNRRALTVEWVDGLYSLAFGRVVAGPYENQESGAALLASLERTGLGDPALSEANRRYLAGRAGGWAARFRNNDDTYYYQLEWITNAYLQSLGGAPPPPEQVRRSIDWLVLQMLPDGAPLRYNFPIGASAAGAAYLGAQLLGDPQYLWMAGRAAEAAAFDPGFVLPQPGLVGPIAAAGRAPTVGSCLIYGDGGLPTRVGPLAPDKIVFRDGWERDSRYLLLNLRFSGWHRYKGTNTISLIYQGGPLVADSLAAERLGWLPAGRNLVRDKRIPRERTSGVLVGRSGLGAVLHRLTGLGGPWAQDPPRSAVVRDFQTGPERDESLSEIRGWRGWTQLRRVLFYHDGPIVVIDRADGPAGARAALSWSLAEPGELAGGRVALGGGAEPAELVVLGLDGADLGCERAADVLICQGGRPGRLAAASILLSGGWVGAEVTLVGGDTLQIRQGDRGVTIPVP